MASDGEWPAPPVNGRRRCGWYNAAMPTAHDEKGVPHLQDVVSFVLKEAERRGASQCEADASVSQGLSVSVRLREVDTVEYQRDRGLGVTVYFGKRKGSASTSDLSAQAVRDTVEKAAAIARFTAEDPYAGLVEPEALAREIPDLDLDHPWRLAPEEAIELARRSEEAGLAVDSRITNSDGASVGSHRHVGVYGNSHGFVGGYAGTSHSVSCSLIAQQGEEMQRDYWYTTARDSADLQSPEIIGRVAGERTVARLGSRKLVTRKAPVLFSPEMARGLFKHFIGAIRGASQYRKASFLLNAAGESVFPPFLQMHERPHILKALASAPFDSEGAATRDRDLVRDGVLDGYVLGSYSARKLGLKTTGNAGGVHNLIVSAPGKALDTPSLLRRLGTGLLVTELMGHGVNAVTGDYSRGASGFWVENGAVTHPVQEITIAGSLRQMFRDIVALGGDIDERGGIRTGSVLVSEMTIAGE
jgi:PmbA protein